MNHFFYAPRDSDFKFMSSGINASSATKSWVPFVPTNVPQFGPLGDKENCITESFCQCCEVDLIYQIDNKLLPQTHLDFLEQGGYYDENGKINFSIKFSSILNGTTLAGNSCNIVAASGRQYGLIPAKMLPNTADTQDWADYYNKAQITPEMLAMGQQFLKYFTIMYQWIYTGGGDRNGVENAVLEKAISAAPIQFVTPICPSWDDPLVTSCGQINPQHATSALEYHADDTSVILDHYGPYIKTLAGDYPIPYAMQFFCKPKDLTSFTYIFNNDLKVEDTTHTDDVKALQKKLFQAGLFYDSEMTTLALIDEFGGYFGDVTLNAVKAFQAKHNLPTTGVVGPLSRSILSNLNN